MTDHITGKIQDMASFRDECAFYHDNVAAEALDALDPAEHARFQRHLQWCGPCRRELADLRKTTSLLPLLSPNATPSPIAKARLFQAIADDAVATSAGGSTASSGATMGNPWAQPEEIRPPATPSPGPFTTPVWRNWAAGALVAPLALALIILGAWTNGLRNDLSSMQAGGTTEAPPTVALGATGEMQLFAMEPSCAECDDSPASGHLGGDPDANVGILVAWNLDPNEQHQVWCEKTNGEMLLVSDLEVEHTGQVTQTVSFPEAIGGYSTIYVTRFDGTEEMRVALNEEIPVDDATPSINEPAGS